MISGGATVVCFTTGRGSVFGSKPTPTLKLATNSDLARRLAGDIDLDCGPVLDGRTIPELGEELLDLIVATASGLLTASEDLGVGNEEIIPWRTGAVM
jgi:altronate hydrolase